jgi:proline iminopeptidase
MPTRFAGCLASRSGQSSAIPLAAWSLSSMGSAILTACLISCWWTRPLILAKRGHSLGTVKTAQRFFTGQITPSEMVPSMMKLIGAYYHHAGPLLVAHETIMGMRMKSRPDAFIFAFSQLLKGWSVMDRLSEIKVPALVMAGRDDFLFPPEHQVALKAGLPNARLELIERAGHNAPSERPTEVIAAVRDFMAAA